ncbi:hypothetical protein V8E53_004571, partial [Lactarius tabidus]
KKIDSYFTKATHSRTSSRQNHTPKATPTSGSVLPKHGQLCKHLDKHQTAKPKPPEHPQQGPTVHALVLLASITDAAHDLPSLVPEAEEDDDITRVVLSGGPEDPSEAWEHLNHGLNRLLGFGVEIEDIAQHIQHGPLGMEGLIGYIHGFVVDYSISGDLLEGKLERLSKAHDLVKQLPLADHLPRPCL